MKLDKILAFSFALLPLLDLYGIGIPSLSVGKILLMIVITIIGINDLFVIKFKNNRLFLLFMIFLIIVPFIINASLSWFSLHDYIFRSISILGFCFSLGILCKYLTWSYFIKYYRFLVYLCVVFFLFQEVAYFMFGYKIIAIIPGIPLVNMESSESYIIMQNSIRRSCSFFFEPTYFVYYISLYYYYIAYKVNNPFKNREFIFLTLILLFARSGNGFIIIITLYLLILIKMFLINNDKNKGLNFLFIFCIAIGGFFVIYELNKIDVFNETFQRFDELSSDSSNLSSGFQRLYAGYYFYSPFDFINLLFGISPGNAFPYYLSHDLHFFKSFQIVDDVSNIYLNGIQTILVFGGGFALFIYVYYLINLCNRNLFFCKSILILLLISHFISSNFNSVFMLYVLVISTIIKYDSNRCSIYK